MCCLPLDWSSPSVEWRCCSAESERSLLSLVVIGVLLANFSRPHHKMLVALWTFLLITFAAIWESICFDAWLSILRRREHLRALFAVLDAATPEPSDSEDSSDEEGASAVADSAVQVRGNFEGFPGRALARSVLGACPKGRKIDFYDFGCCSWSP